MAVAGVSDVLRDEGALQSSHRAQTQLAPIRLKSDDVKRRRGNEGMKSVNSGYVFSGELSGQQKAKLSLSPEPPQQQHPFGSGSFVSI